MLNENIEAHTLTGFTHCNNHLVIKGSSIHGNGIFSKKYFTSGSILFNIVANKNQHENSRIMADLNPNWIGIGYEEWLVVNDGDLASFINHSCLPNIVMNDNFEIVSIRPIKMGEELLMDYSTTELDPYWSMSCCCGLINCRKIILSFQNLPKSIQIKYLNSLSASFVKEFKRIVSHQIVI